MLGLLRLGHGVLEGGGDLVVVLGLHVLAGHFRGLAVLVGALGGAEGARLGVALQVGGV